jgi:integral membrane protein (TIGR01906 family)
MARGQSARWPGIAAGFVTVTLPLFLLLTGVLLLLLTARWWVPAEYRMPWFPADRYGFTLEDRLKWSRVDIEFLLGSDEIDYYEGFFLDDGAPMHNDRELRHMEDVKTLVGMMRGAWIVSVVILVGASLALLRAREGARLLEAYRVGSLAALLILVGIGLLLLFAFGFLFVGFHRIFFEGNTWIFAFSDTFIRLYPQRFWQDTFGVYIIITVFLSGVIYLVSRRLLRGYP